MLRFILFPVFHLSVILNNDLMIKVLILQTESPKAQNALWTIEEILLAKAKNIRLPNFRRASKLAGLVSTKKLESGSLCNTFFASKNRTDDKAWVTVAIVLMGSGALGKDLMALTTVLGDSLGRRYIDCSVLMDVSARIHEITKDITDLY